MVLEYQELEKLIDNLTAKITDEVRTANRTGILEEVLEKYDYHIEENVDSWMYSDNSKVIVIGQIDLKEQEIKGCVKSLGLDYSRFEFYKDYEKLPQINFAAKLENNDNYSDVMVCAMPHSMAGVSEGSSLTSMIENNQSNYPKLTRITDESGILKFTKNGFKKALEKTNLYRDTFE